MGGWAERLARLLRPTLEPAPGSLGQCQALGVALDLTEADPSAARGTFTVFGARHVKGVALSRWIAAVCFVIAAVALMAFGYWWGAFFFLAAGLNGSLAYLVPRWNLLRDAPKNVKRARVATIPGARGRRRGRPATPHRAGPARRSPSTDGRCRHEAGARPGPPPAKAGHRATRRPQFGIRRGQGRTPRSKPGGTAAKASAHAAPHHRSR